MAEEKTLHNTGCSFVANDTSHEVYIVSGEDNRHNLLVPKGKFADFHGVIFPWCNRTAEVREKAFRLYRGNDQSGEIFLYLFQDYSTQVVYYSQTGNYDDKVRCGPNPASYVNVLLTREGTADCTEN